LIELEASGRAHWFRGLNRLGHTVRLIAPQFVKPYVKSQKNDANDTEAICEAVSRPSMRFVPVKTVEQQDLQCLHRVRSRLIGCRTQLVNQIRGLLAEYGIVIPKHVAQLRRHLLDVLEDDGNELTISGRCLFHSLYEELVELETRIGSADERIEWAFRENTDCQRITAVEGNGSVTATAVAISGGRAFRNGRQFAAWLGSGTTTTFQRRQGAATGDQQARRSLSAHVAGARSQVGGLPREAQDPPPHLLDQRQAAAPGNCKGLRRRGQQERAHSLVADGEAT
jgi:transposase